LCVGIPNRHPLAKDTAVGSELLAETIGEQSHDALAWQLDDERFGSRIKRGEEPACSAHAGVAHHGRASDRRVVQQVVSQLLVQIAGVAHADSFTPAA
jgi:hypothetical protein